MPKSIRAFLGLFLLLFSGEFCILQAQITGGYWVSSVSGGLGLVCNDDQLDTPAGCAAHAYCTKPPNTLSSFDIGARAYASCPNQGVENSALTSGSVGGIQAVASAKAVALFYNRLIKAQSRTADCNGNTAILQDYTDPYGCDPPPPPPPCNCNGCSGECRPKGCSSPVVIDLFDEGMHFTSLQEGVQFDLNGDGKPLFLSWTDPNYHNAWLALDRNHNGKIDSVQELFGYLTEPQMPSRDRKRNGWLALAVYDEPSNGGNGDGVIDANDAIYRSLLLWIDSNHDGISQPEELHPPAEMSVTGIPLAYTHKSYKDDKGNNFRFENFVSMESDRHQAWDVVLDASDDPPGRDVFCLPEKK
jgi:hypothetical protein